MAPRKAKAKQNADDTATAGDVAVADAPPVIDLPSIDTAAWLLGVPAVEISAVEAHPAGPLIRTRDGIELVITDDGLRIANPPARYSGTIPVLEWEYDDEDEAAVDLAGTVETVDFGLAVSALEDVLVAAVDEGILDADVTEALAERFATALDGAVDDPGEGA